MGNLYIVSTPIGNLQDISIRAANTLLESAIIVTESTSKAGILLDFLEKEFGKKRTDNLRIISLTENEEEHKIFELLSILADKDIALVSEAGTPLISDPGYKLTREAIKNGANVIPIPGSTAPIAALTASGLPTDKFIFTGYLPKKPGKRIEMLKKFHKIKQLLPSTIIFFESPHRLVESLEKVNEVLGDIDIVVARELTKMHEEIRREKVIESINYFKKNNPKGEFVILL